jgi:uncharacterized protein YbaA (DUF1428 family)
MSYIDVFVLPVPQSRLDDYRAMAGLACQVWLDHGALSYQEFLADNVPDGEVTSFPLSVQLKEGEKVGIGFARYRSREHRDEVFEKVMADKRMCEYMPPEQMPFDGQRMIWGGFSQLLGSDD